MNVADMIGEKLDARAVQCYPDRADEDTMECQATTTHGKGFQPDWKMEVDKIQGNDLETMRHSTTVDITSIPPAGGMKECIPRLGSGKGRVELVCRPENQHGKVAHNRPDSFKPTLRRRNLQYEELQ